jgi:hypothetical protein
MVFSWSVTAQVGALFVHLEVLFAYLHKYPTIAIFFFFLLPALPSLLQVMISNVYRLNLSISTE